MNDLFIHFGKYCGWMFYVKRRVPCPRPYKSGGFVCCFQTVVKIRLGIVDINAYIWERDAKGKDFANPTGLGLKAA